MTARIVVTPDPAPPGSVVDLALTGFDVSLGKVMLTTVDSAGTESGFTDGDKGKPSNINRLRRDGSQNVGIKVPPLEGPAKIRAYQGAALSAEASVLVQTPVVDPPDPPDPPSVGDFYLYPGTIPTGATRFKGGSLGAFLSGLSAGSVGVLDYNGTIKESIDIALKDGVTVLPAPGKRTWLDGSLRISGGEGVTFYGLNVTWTNADSSGHMVKIDGGSIDYGYAELAHAACYTLLRPGQKIHDSRIHHLWVHDNPGVSSHDGNQDHGLYCSAVNPDQKVKIDHCLIEGMPRGRNIKIGGPSAGGAIGGISVDRCTLRLGHGPSNFQVSNGATGCRITNSVLIDSGASTSCTTGSGVGSGNQYGDNLSDKPTGPNSSSLKDIGGNVVKANLSDYAANGKAGKGHLG